MSGFVDHEVEEASEDEEVSGDDDEVDENRSVSKKKAGGKNRSRVIDSSDEDEDDGEFGSFAVCLAPHVLNARIRRGPAERGDEGPDQ